MPDAIPSTDSAPAPANLARILAFSCHPAPALAVTAFGTALAADAGNSASRCVLVAVAVLAGQLSIGWSNDRIDADRDRQSGRADKPLATSRSVRRSVDLAIVAAVASTVVFSLLLGWPAGLLHLAAVTCGWLYNLGGKATVLSWLPYGLAFGALPAVGTLALPHHQWPAWWVPVGGALLGITAHLANTVPDLEDDEATGVRGLPHRLGARASSVLALALATLASVIVTLAPNGPPHVYAWVLLAVGVAVSATATAITWRQPRSRIGFYAAMLVAAIDVALLLSAGRAIVG